MAKGRIELPTRGFVRPLLHYLSYLTERRELMQNKGLWAHENHLATATSPNPAFLRLHPTSTDN